MKNNLEKFRELFKEFEHLTKEKLGNNKLELNKAISELKNKRIEPYYSEYDFLDFCRFCRNRDAHSNDEAQYIIYTDKFIDKLEKIIDLIKNPPTVYEKSTKPVRAAQSTDYVRKIMQEMSEYNYTHIPIYDNEKLIGIFNESTIFNYLNFKNNIQIEENTTFNDIKDCFLIPNKTEIVKFAPKDKNYNEIIIEFINEFKKRERLSCFMITEDGSANHKIIGIITAWDIIGKKE